MSNPTIDKHGTQKWYQDGYLHREDSPALIFANGTQYWYRNGKIHREDGPAVMYADGTRWWYLNDTYYSFDQWADVVGISQDLKIMYKLQYS